VELDRAKMLIFPHAKYGSYRSKSQLPMGAAFIKLPSARVRAPSVEGSMACPRHTFSRCSISFFLKINAEIFLYFGTNQLV
jgi:hypothetical protein